MVTTPQASESLAPSLRVTTPGVDPSPRPGESNAARLDRVDTELMVAFRDSGSPEVFEELYAHARARVFQWLRVLVRQRGSRIDPVEMVQDTFVNVYRYAHSFRHDHTASFRTWVRTIASNVLRRALHVAPRHSMQALPEGLQEPVDGRMGPHLRLVQGEEHEALREAWVLFLQHYAEAYDSLSPRDRRALALVEVDGLSYAETSERLGVGPSNMKMIMLRSRRRLQNRMRKAMFDEPLPASTRRAAEPSGSTGSAGPQTRSLPRRAVAARTARAVG